MRHIVDALGEAVTNISFLYGFFDFRFYFCHIDKMYVISSTAGIMNI